eukprot:SAG31_NODE_9328_length_1296_cov_64.877193_2_plen_93_part_00
MVFGTCVNTSEKPGSFLDSDKFGTAVSLLMTDDSEIKVADSIPGLIECYPLISYPSEPAPEPTVISIEDAEVSGRVGYSGQPTIPDKLKVLT